MAVLRYVTELECRFTFVIKGVGMWLYVNSFGLCLCGYLSGRDYAMESAGGRVISRPTFPL
jgi:hypothetical protein